MSGGWDAVVVGARVAGAATALLLARSGHRVLLIDRAAFPSDTASTLYIHQPGVAKLAEWGVLPALLDSGCPALDTIGYEVGGVRLAGPAPVMPGAPAAFAPRRRVLDQLLVDAAVKAGVEFADRANLQELVHSDGRVTGVRFRTASGVRTEHARLVVGADGMRSRVARLVDAPVESGDPRASCVYYTGWTGLSTGFGFHESPGNWIVRIPTHDDLTLISTYFPQDRFTEIRQDPFRHHLAAVRATAPGLYQQLTEAEQVEPIIGTGDQQNYFRRGHGPGWVLVGDAGHHLDTISARGITNALLQAAFLAEELTVDPADPVRLDAALARFTRRRDEALTEPYQSTLELARLTVTPARLRMLREIAESPALTGRYFAVVAGMLGIDELFDDEDLDDDELFDDDGPDDDDVC
ncbi:NAD(P)/FAD-dependent oxidoreductase [Streptomyces sp. CBMA123]|uniref:NAD(P)/FAD-dependent oxidoreductase n=1 Tax=Streptomyces sp. CBMA123 TaxID=1896313 RepID=UPI0016619646|nr:FAD-dependent monooxygenase [Streptomyces sp. CBMA123]MBD0695413.1 FAD-dependent oxidoreductase [Streptomyces sp. CBMA123]